MEFTTRCFILGLGLLFCDCFWKYLPVHPLVVFYAQLSLQLIPASVMITYVLNLRVLSI
jgi:hypothetical protein